jgi:hypothetical protein
VLPHCASSGGDQSHSEVPLSTSVNVDKVDRSAPIIEIVLVSQTNYTASCSYSGTLPEQLQCLNTAGGERVLGNVSNILLWNRYPRRTTRYLHSCSRFYLEDSTSIGS